jgi:adenosylmethionine-8-amino-7-oxononanoate aminotransferase
VATRPHAIGIKAIVATIIIDWHLPRRTALSANRIAISVGSTAMINTLTDPRITESNYLDPLLVLSLASFRIAHRHETLAAIRQHGTMPVVNLASTQNQKQENCNRVKTTEAHL